MPSEFFAAVRDDAARPRRLDHAADPGHEPGLHRQGRLLHRHQAGPAGRRGRGARTASGWPRWPGWPGAATRPPSWTRPGGSWSSARTTTRSPAPRATRSTWTCWPAGGKRTSAGDAARRRRRRHLAGLAATPARHAGGAGRTDRAVVVFNTLSAARSGPGHGSPWTSPGPGTAVDQPGRRRRRRRSPFLAEGVRRHADGSLAGLTLTFRAGDVPALGYRTYWVAARRGPGGGPGRLGAGRRQRDRERGVPGRGRPGARAAR